MNFRKIYINIIMRDLYKLLIIFLIVLILGLTGLDTYNYGAYREGVDECEEGDDECEQRLQ